MPFCQSDFLSSCLSVCFLPSFQSVIPACPLSRVSVCLSESQSTCLSICLSVFCLSSSLHQPRNCLTACLMVSIFCLPSSLPILPVLNHAFQSVWLPVPLPACSFSVVLPACLPCMSPAPLFCPFVCLTLCIFPVCLCVRFLSSFQSAYPTSRNPAFLPICFIFCPPVCLYVSFMSFF